MFILETCTVATWCLIKTIGVVLMMPPLGIGPLLICLIWLWVTGQLKGERK